MRLSEATTIIRHSTIDLRHSDGRFKQYMWLLRYPIPRQ